MLHRIARLGIVAVLCLATLAYSALDKRVTVEIEGRPVSIRTFASNVGDALARAGVHVGPHDRIVPSPATGIDDGEVIHVFRAKLITLVLDGHARRIMVTGTTIGQVLAEIRLRGSLADLVRPSRATRVVPGMTITYRRALSVILVHDGKAEHVITNSRTVGALIRDLGLKLGPQDRLVPPAAAHPQMGQTIRLIRIGVRPVVRRVEIPFRTVLKRDRHLEYGLRRVSTHGHPGAREYKYLIKYQDGRPVWRKLVRSSLLRSPQPRVILIGASFPGCICDKGTEAGDATWYGEAKGMTAAHKTLPMGTVVHVRNLANGRWVNVTIRDRGPYGAHRIIDLSEEAFSRLASPSTGVVHVRIWW